MTLHLLSLLSCVSPHTFPSFHLLHWEWFRLWVNSQEWWQAALRVLASLPSLRLCPSGRLRWAQNSSTSVGYSSHPGPQGWEPWTEELLRPPPHDPSPGSHRCSSSTVETGFPELSAPTRLGCSAAPGPEKYVVGSTWQGTGRNGGCWCGLSYMGARKSLCHPNPFPTSPPSLPGGLTLSLHNHTFLPLGQPSLDFSPY